MIDFLTELITRHPLLISLTALFVLACSYAVAHVLKAAVHETETLKAPDEVKPMPKSLVTPPNGLDTQSIQDGVGAYFHREYGIDIHASRLDPRQLIAKLKADLNAATPGAIASFEKTKSVRANPESFSIGDEFHIHILGPWDGPVRVADEDATSFSFVTREGHLEAGGIRFRARLKSQSGFASSMESETATKSRGAPTYEIFFSIESWSRSRDHLVDFVYDKVPAARFAQTQMWAKFCEAVAEISGGQASGLVQVKTEKAPAGAPDDLPMQTNQV